MTPIPLIRLCLLVVIAAAACAYFTVSDPSHAAPLPDPVPSPEGDPS